MTQQLSAEDVGARDEGPGPRVARVSDRTVVIRRLVGMLVVAVPLIWALLRALPEAGDLVNRGGLALLDDLLGTALRPSLDRDFLAVVVDAAGTTVVFAALGTAGALIIGMVGGLVLSDVAWDDSPPWAVRAVRLVLRGVLVAFRSIHELIWALLFVSVLGLDPLVAILAIAVPFGAQTAKVFAETLDAVPPGPQALLRNSGARRASALAFGLLPAAGPLLLSYSFYRFECAIRSVVLLGVVGVGGLGQELVVSLQSRNWDEVWTLVGALLLLSAAVDLWSTKVRADLAVVTCSDWSVSADRRRLERAGQASTRVRSASRWPRWSAAAVPVGLVAAWLASGASLGGLAASRTRDRTSQLAQDMWPPALPSGGWATLTDGVLDTVAMAILAMAVAVVISVVVGPWATRPRPAWADSGSNRTSRWVRSSSRWLARAVLLVLRSVPPTVWAIVALLALFPGILPGALALGLYTGGILGRLVAEAWESLDTRARDALGHAGVTRPVAAVAAMTAPSAHHLITYTLYRFEICVRDTAVVGVVGAAGLGRLFAENLAAFRFPVVTTLLIASFAVSVAAEVAGRWMRNTLRA